MHFLITAAGDKSPAHLEVIQGVGIFDSRSDQSHSSFSRLGLGSPSSLGMTAKCIAERSTVSGWVGELSPIYSSAQAPVQRREQVASLGKARELDRRFVTDRAVPGKGWTPNE
jgi:hypothetical protein